METHLVGDDLMMVMIPRSRKAADVRRDDRIVLQSPITDPANPGAEYKLRGRAAQEKDEAQLRKIADAVEATSGWRPSPQWLFAKVMLELVTVIEWEPEGSASLTQWSPSAGLSSRRLRLDMDAGAYLSE